MEPRLSLAGPFNILVVEDEYLIAMELRKLLRDSGYGVVGPVNTVTAALAVLEGEPPDACVLDVSLRGEHSAPVARALRARFVPFVLSSAYHQDMLDQYAEFAGIINIDKPVRPEVLCSALAGLLVIQPTQER